MQTCCSLAFLAAAALLSPAPGALAAQAPGSEGPWILPVAVVSYFPLAGDRIDIRVTGDWGDTYAATKAKCERLTRETIAALEEGSRYHGYKDPEAKPSIRYRVVRAFEFQRPMPTRPLRPGEKVPLTDYHRIMADIGIRDLVEGLGVKEVWIWGYHGGVLNLWESNLASPFGDVSNSNRDPNDLPVLAKSYTVYHYNYQRGAGEAVEDHTHQIEALLNHVDGRDRTPPDQWPSLLFWGKFVGSDRSHKIITNPARCGWTHYAPNSERDYDWANKRFVETDIEDWRPDGVGRTQRINCDRWGGDGLKWKVYWMQNLPGARNGLTYGGKPLRNWWLFVGDWDRAMRRKLTLVGE